MKIDLYHCSRNNMTYLQHSKRALKICLKSSVAASAALIHAVIPCILCDTASMTIKKLNDWLQSEEIK